MIRFKRIRWSNFLMTGDHWTEILLDQTSTMLVYGRNGSGKSTLLDALMFALFGVPFRNCNVPDLINDTNGRDMVVELDFDVANINYKIRRGLKPRLFEIFVNNKMINQDAKSRDYQKYLEQNILKFNKKTFSQVVILGSASFVPFMQLAAADRRAIIEDLLDIQIFSVMNKVLKDRIQDMKDEYVDLANQLELQNEKILIVEAYIRKLKSDNESAIAAKRDLITSNQENKDLINGQIKGISDAIDDLEEKCKDYAALKERLRILESSKDKLESSLVKIKKEIRFFGGGTENDTFFICPTCQQHIDNDFRSKMYGEKTKKADEIQTAIGKIEDDILRVETRLDKISNVQKSINRSQEAIKNLTISISVIDSHLKQIQQEIKDLQETDGDVEQQQNKLVTLQQNKLEMTRQQDDLTDRKYRLDIVAMMLKDTGIKTKIIKQYLPVINKYVNKYLSAMDFFANFTLDENFKDIIHIRGSKERSYFQLSEGQKLRIDLAILFTWRDIAKLKNSANTNLLIMDEVFESALDDNGIDDFLKLIQSMGSNTNIFVLSPKGETMLDKFNNVIKFKEERGFAIMELG